MENKGVKCDVKECLHNYEANKCRLDTIEVTHMCTGDDCVSVPHFCKSYESRKSILLKNRQLGNSRLAIFYF